MSISVVCNELHIACQLYPTKTRYPTISPPPGVLAFAFDDADHRLIDAFTAAGLITAKADQAASAMQADRGTGTLDAHRKR